MKDESKNPERTPEEIKRDEEAAKQPIKYRLAPKDDPSSLRAEVYETREAAEAALEDLETPSEYQIVETR